MVMELPVPPGLTFVSATDGGSLLGGVVTWNLGTLLPGDIGERRATFAVDAAIAGGSIIKAEALIDDDNNQPVIIADTTRINGIPPLDIDIALSPSAVGPGDSLTVTLGVSNTSPFERADVQMRMRYPLSLVDLSHSLTGGGFCDGSVTTSLSQCEPTEQLIWNLGTIPANTSFTRTFTPTVRSATLEGSVIEFTAWVQDTTERARVTDLLRVGMDTDDDGLPDSDESLYGTDPLRCRLGRRRAH